MLLFQIETEQHIQALIQAWERFRIEVGLEPSTREDYLKHDPSQFILHPPVRTALLRAKPMTRPTHRPYCRSRLLPSGLTPSCDDPLGH